MSKNRFFIVGTDTGVGKTVLSLLMMQYLYERDLNPFYLKPFQTGCKDPYDTDSDARFVYKHVKQLAEKDPADSVIYCYTTPKAPYFAGRDQGESINMGLVRKVVDEKSELFGSIVIEAAGGLLVPVNESLLVIDVLQQVNAKPILAARAGLGTINHTLLSIKAMQKRNILPGGVVFMDESDPGVPDESVYENMEAVERFSGIKVAGVIRKIHDFSNPGDACYKVIDKLVA